MTLEDAAEIVLETRKTGGASFPDDNVEQFLNAAWMLLEAAMDGKDIRTSFKK